MTRIRLQAETDHLIEMVVGPLWLMLPVLKDSAITFGPHSTIGMQGRSAFHEQRIELDLSN